MNNTATFNTSAIGGWKRAGWRWHWNNNPSANALDGRFETLNASHVDVNSFSQTSGWWRRSGTASARGINNSVLDINGDSLNIKTYANSRNGTSIATGIEKSCILFNGSIVNIHSEAHGRAAC